MMSESFRMSARVFEKTVRSSVWFPDPSRTCKCTMLAPARAQSTTSRATSSAERGLVEGGSMFTPTGAIPTMIFFPSTVFILLSSSRLYDPCDPDDVRIREFVQSVSGNG